MTVVVGRTGDGNGELARGLPESAFWAKLAPGTWHPLWAHLADVAAVIACLLSGRSSLGVRLARAMGEDDVLPSGVRARVVYLAALHDMGKAQHGFQDRRYEARPLTVMAGHLLPLLRSLKNPVPVTGLREVVQTMARRAGGMDAWLAAIGHHGRPLPLSAPSSDVRPFWLPRGGRDPMAELWRLEALARRWSGVGDNDADRAMPAWSPSALHLLAGIITLADWIGSSLRYFPLIGREEVDPNAYWDRAREHAHRACDEIGLLPAPIVVATGDACLRQLFPSTFPQHRPTALQRHLVEMPMPKPGTRLLIESDTGSGKTEAVLALYARMRATGRCDGLFFALPTRATAHAMHARVHAAVGALHAAGTAPPVGLATGGRQGTTHGDVLGAVAQQMPDPEDPEPATLAPWTSQSNRHAMAGEVIVGTVDQALLAVLAARHAHLRLAGLSRHLLVIDEVHAYDRYMTTALRTLAGLHTRMGGLMVFMSATLATETRELLGDENIDTPVPSRRAAIARPYPSISMRPAGAPAWEEVALPSPPERARAVGWSMVSEHDALEAAVATASRGGVVAILRNTVRDARATVAQLEQWGVGALLWRPSGARAGTAYHARYTRADRDALDTQVRRDFGPGERVSGVILVTTQVAEQSLDVDFDLLVTDLCPVDVLLQRIGRVHRHARPHRSGCKSPTAIVITPTTAFDALVAANRRQSTRGHGTVYRDFGDLELTRRLINAHATIRIPEDSRRLVETVYHEECREALRRESTAWAQHLDSKDGDALGEETLAYGCIIRFDLPYADAENTFRFGTLAAGAGEAEARVRTRLGDDRVRLELPGSVGNRYARDGLEDAFVDIDVRMLQRAGLAPATIDRVPVDGWHKDGAGVRCTIGRLWVTYGDSGWEWGVS